MDREDVGAGLRSLHIARKGRRGRHLILFAAKRIGFVLIVVGAVLFAIAFSAFLDVQYTWTNPWDSFWSWFFEGPSRAFSSWGREVRGWAAALSWIAVPMIVMGAPTAAARCARSFSAPATRC